MDLDREYINGLEDGVNMTKAIFALSTSERESRFGSADVAQILDKFDFAQIKELMSAEIEVQPEIKGYYVLRGYKDGECVVVSTRFKFPPQPDLIDGFIRLHTLPDSEMIDYAVAEHRWVRE